MQRKKLGEIILLNGTSSSGKSAILKELQHFAPDYVLLKVDDFYPEELNQKALELGWIKDSGTDPWIFLHQYMTAKTGNYYFDTELRELLFKASTFFYSQAKKYAAQGKTVIIDTVLEYENAYQEALEYFKDDNFSIILIYCPMDILLKRVLERNNSGNADEYRNAFQSFEQFPHMYKLKESDGELLVDKVNSAPLKGALETAIQDLIDHGIAHEYLPRLQKFKKDFITQFKLDQLQGIELAPRHRYKAVFKNEDVDKPKIIAKQIKKLIAI